MAIIKYWKEVWVSNKLCKESSIMRINKLFRERRIVMKKFLSVVAVSLSFGTVAVLGTSAKAHAATTDAKNYIYRVYNPNSGEHLYTPSEFEEKTLINFG